MELLEHIQQGHEITPVEGTFECSCGSLFRWPWKESAALRAASPGLREQNLPVTTTAGTELEGSQGKPVAASGAGSPQLPTGRDGQNALITRTTDLIVRMVNEDATYGDVEDALAEFLAAATFRGAPLPAQTPEIVYVVDGGDYENYGWGGVYATLDAAMAAHPLPEMRAIPGVQVDPTYRLERPGGWLRVEDPRCPDGEWWNGFSGDFGNHIHAVRLEGASLPAQTPQTWQPIESAPKDGTDLLLWCPVEHDVAVAGFQHVGYWDDFSDGWQIPDTNMYIQPTHWMPLPTSPRTSSAAPESPCG